MPRARAELVIALGALLVVMGLAHGPTGAAPPAPPTTTIATQPSTPASTVPASTPVSAVAEPPASTIPRAASGTVDVHKPEDESWQLRQVLTILGLAIVALAALGYAYGRIRSIGPRHPGLMRIE